MVARQAAARHSLWRRIPATAPSRIDGPLKTGPPSSSEKRTRVAGTRALAEQRFTVAEPAPNLVAYAREQKTKFVYFPLLVTGLTGTPKAVPAWDSARDHQFGS
jgi:hypothetical protein